MHFIVTARITPLSPGASPPPVSIPTLRTSAISPSLSERARRVSLANQPCGNAGGSGECCVHRKGKGRQRGGFEYLPPSGPPDEAVPPLGGFGVTLDDS